MTLLQVETKYKNIDEYESLSKRIFSLIELIELAGVKGEEFKILRRRILNAGNDVLRLMDGDGDGIN